MIEHGERLSENLHPAGHHVRVHGALRALAHAALDQEHELVAHLLGDLERLSGVGVEYHLHKAFAVAQIDEDHPAVIAAPMHPAAQADRAAQQVLGHLTAIVASHRKCPLGKSRDGKVSPPGWQQGCRRCTRPSGPSRWPWCRRRWISCSASRRSCCSCPSSCQRSCQRSYQSRPWRRRPWRQRPVARPWHPASSCPCRGNP